MTASRSDSARIGIFGGSFNPPHVGHLIIAETICDQFQLDHILWIPSYQNPLKRQQDLAPVAERLTMTRLAIHGNHRFLLSEIEIARAGSSYTVDTVRQLQEESPGTDFQLILGTDSLADLPRWRDPEEILSRVRVIAFRRLGSEDARVRPEFGERVVYADAPLIDLSGTLIRERARAGRSIRYMVPDAVRHYIEERRLYVLSNEE